jgi:lipooligosaccharide transport system permease protein
VVRPLAWISPLWHGTELARAAALDAWRPLAALGHLAYLLALLLVGGVLAVRLFGRRLAR